MKIRIAVGQLHDLTEERLALCGADRRDGPADEQPDAAPAEVMLLLARNGFDGFLLDDHVPKMDGDSDWNHRGRAHAIGYMQGLVRMAEYLGE